MHNRLRITIRRHVRLALVLALTTAASLGSVVGVSSPSAAPATAARRVRWYHCHATSSPLTKRVHICGDSGTLHGISVTSRPDGHWPRTRHRHDRGGEGCR